MKGIAINVMQFEGMTPVQIMNMTIQKSKEEGCSYFSSDIPFSAKKLQQDAVLFYMETSNEGLKYVLADVVKILRNQDGEPFVPEDAALYSPAMFAKEPRCSWLLVKNFRMADEDYVNSLVGASQKDGKWVSVKEMIGKSRTNRCYWLDADGVEEQQEAEKLVF